MNETPSGVPKSRSSRSASDFDGGPGGLLQAAHLGLGAAEARGHRRLRELRGLPQAA
nr:MULTISPECIES: hypothetical protein [Microbispora]